MLGMVFPDPIVVVFFFLSKLHILLIIRWTLWDGIATDKREYPHNIFLIC